MFNKSKYTLVLILLAAFFSTNLYAQNAKDVSYAILPQSTMSIDGNSTLHKWKCNIKEMSGEIALPEAVADQNALKVGDSFTVTNVTIPIKEIKSTESNSMNKKIYGALKQKKNPDITYQLVSAKVVAPSDSVKNQYILDTTGKLTIAGSTKTIEMKIAGQVMQNGNLRFQGKKDLKMTDFDVKPPTAFFGTIKSSDEILISFDLFAAKKMHN